MLIIPKHTIDEALSDVKDQLTRAAADNHHKMRLFSVSTLDLDTHSISNRMVVLRTFFNDWRVRFYTDFRTRKVLELKQNPQTSLLFWDSSKNIQIRMKTTAIIYHNDDLSKREWTHVQGEARKSYNSRLKPGSPIASPDEAHLWPAELSDEYFTVIDCIPFSLQILQLNRQEHLSLTFTRTDPVHEWEGGWIVP